MPKWLFRLDNACFSTHMDGNLFAFTATGERETLENVNSQAVFLVLPAIDA